MRTPYGIGLLVFGSALIAVLVGPARADSYSTTNYQSPGSWEADLGQDCMDVYDFQVPAGTAISITVGDVTGSSVVRLALYGPGLGLGGTNRLTGTAADLQCGGQDETTSLDVVLTEQGTYRLAVVRDWGSSAGFDGTYDLTVTSDQTVLALGSTANDVTSPTTLAACVDIPLPYAATAAGSWSCDLGETCQDLYEFQGTEGERVTIDVFDVTGNSVPRLALFAPGDATSGINLLTGDSLDRECVGQDADDSVANFVLPSTGTYLLAVGRDWGSSAGASGSYDVRVSSSAPIGTLTFRRDDVASEALGSVCGLTGGNDLVVGGSWDCELGETCQDLWEVQLVAGSEVTLSVFDVTGNSVPRLAVFGPGVAPDGTNLLTGTNFDRECVGQDGDDVATFTALAGGAYTVAVGRDWGSSAGFGGTYTLGVSSDIAAQGIALVADDVPSQAAGSACQGADTILDLAETWECQYPESCQDVYELELNAGTTLTVAVSDVTGGSVPRLALFAPGEPWNGTNLLTGTNRDRECVGQDADDGFVDLAIEQTGTYALAVGRDWGSSVGFTGGYALRVTSSGPVLAQLVSDDLDSEAAGSVCSGTDVVRSGTWDCDLGESCMDVFDVEVEAGTQLSLDVFDVTGNSVPRLAIFGPGEPLGGTNLITGENLDRECVGQDASDSAGPVLAAIGGTYRVAIVRDWGSSAGFVGSYSMRLRSDTAVDFQGQVLDDVTSQAAGSVCRDAEPNTFVTQSGWECDLGETCMDLYEFELDELSEITIEVEALTGSSVPRLALYRPGQEPNGVDVLTGGPTDRECVGQDATDVVSLRVAEAGVYTLAVGRDWGSSAGFDGSYALKFSADKSFVALGQVADDVSTQQPDSSCDEPMTTRWVADSTWDCALSTSCQDVYEIFVEAGTYLSLAVTDVEGASVPRLALFAPGEPLSGVNLLTRSNQDRRCVGQDEDDVVNQTVATQTGVYRLAVGRDWNSSAGFAGSYRVTVSSEDWLTPLGQIVDDAGSQAEGSVCGTPVDAPSTPGIDRDQLVGAFPNPFNPRTTVSFEIAREGAVQVQIFDVRGRGVRTLVDEPMASGRHQIVWDGLGDDGRRVASGVYFVRMESREGRDGLKLLLLK